MMLLSGRPAFVDQCLIATIALAVFEQSARASRAPWLASARCGRMSAVTSGVLTSAAYRRVRAVPLSGEERSWLKNRKRLDPKRTSN